MIDLSTLNAIHRQATESLQAYRIAEGLRGLDVLMQECQDQQLAREAEAAELDYSRMLDFLAEGGHDDNHPSIQDELVRRLLRTLDATARQVRLQKAEDLYGKAHLRLVQSFGTEAANILRMQWNEQQGMTERYETEDLLFDLLWTMPVWNSHHTAEWYEFISRLDELTKQHLTGAVILSLWEYFDAEKFTLLCLLSESEQEAPRILAIMGYVLLALKYEERLGLYDTLRLNSKDRETVHIVQLLQRELLLMRESPKVNKAINRELARLNLQQTDPAELHRQLENAMQRYGRLLALGIDLDLNKASLLHSSRFLRSVSHWWAPFDESRPIVQDMFIRQDGELAEGLRNMFSRSAECSVNRYAICEAMQQHVNLASLDQQLMQFVQQQNEEDEDEDSEELRPDEEEKARINHRLRQRLLTRGFVQNAYRFFHHSPLMNEVTNPFEANLILSDDKWLRSFLPTSQQQQTAHLLLQFQQHAEALRILRHIADREGFSAQRLRMMGQCLQGEGDLKGAVQYYNQADLLEADDPWTLSQMEICYVNLKHYDRLWDILQRLDRLQPDDVGIARRMAACLLMQGKHAEALNYLYKVELADADDPSTLTQIALSSAHIGRSDTALKYLGKRLEHERPLQKEERLMAGAVYLAQGNWPEALSFFRQADLEAFDTFRPQLLSLGISEHDIQLLRDIIERSR